MPLGINLCPLHWQADSQPLDHWGGPYGVFSEELSLILAPRCFTLACLASHKAGLFSVSTVERALGGEQQPQVPVPDPPNTETGHNISGPRFLHTLRTEHCSPPLLVSMADSTNRLKHPCPQVQGKAS